MKGQIPSINLFIVLRIHQKYGQDNVNIVHKGCFYMHLLNLRREENVLLRHIRKIIWWNWWLIHQLQLN